jgi:hypothetical protein
MHGSGGGYNSRYGNNNNNMNNNNNGSSVNGKSENQNPTASFMYGGYSVDGLDGTNSGGNSKGMDTPGGHGGAGLDTLYDNRVQILGGIRTPGLQDSGRRYGRGSSNINSDGSGLRHRKTPYSSQRLTSGRKQRSKTPRGTPRSNGPPTESLSARKFRDRGQRSTGTRSKKSMNSILNDSTNDVNSAFKSPMARLPLGSSVIENGGINGLAYGKDDEWLNRWITIFGFDPAVTTYILSYFENFGDIVEHKNGKSNTIDVQYATVQEALRARNGQDVKIFNISIPDRPGIFVGVSSTRAMLNDGMLRYDGIPQRTLKDGSRRSKVQSPGSRLLRSESEIHQGPQPAILDSSSIMEEPRREYNCVQKIVRFLFLGTS